jgi:hypothetical protein
MLPRDARMHVRSEKIRLHPNPLRRTLLK